MIHKILVAMDNSAIGDYVFDTALSSAKAVEADMMLLHVLSDEEEGSPDSFGLDSLDLYPKMRLKELKFYQN